MIYTYACYKQSSTFKYGVATIGRLLKSIGLFCRIASLLQGSFAQETYHFKEPTNRRHPRRGSRGMCGGTLYIHTYIFAFHLIYLYVFAYIYIKQTCPYTYFYTEYI